MDQILEPIPPQSGNPAFLAVATHDTSHSPQKDALRYFLRSDDADALSALVRLDQRTKRRPKALARLVRLDRARARRLVFEIASALSGDERIQLLASLLPERGEEANWQAFADSSENLPERLVRLVQADCAADDAGGWSRAHAVIRLLDALAAPHSGELDSGSQETLGPWGGWDAGRLHEEVGQMVPVVLFDIASVLSHARMLGHPAVDVVVRAAIGAEHLRARAMEQPGWWLLVGMELGKEALVSMLELAHSQGLGDEFIRGRLYVLAQREESRPVVLRAATHLELRDAASQVAPALVLPARPDAARAILGQLPLFNDSGEPARCTSAWIRHWAAVDGGAAIDWLRTALTEHAPTARHAWWQQIVSVLPPGNARADAIEEWVGCSTG